MNDAPVAEDDIYSMNQTATLTVPAPGVLSNDSDIESPLTASLVTPPAVGTLSFNSNGSFTYTPPLLFSGTVSFVYSVSDGNGGTDTATVVITVNPNIVGVGRMTGGGSVFTSSNERVTHGMVLLCNAAASPQNLEINWGKGNNFKLTSVTSMQCVNDPSIGPEPPPAAFDTLAGTGVGKFNNATGYTIEFVFNDAGEPGRLDRATFTIRDSGGNVVITVSGNLNNGNQQAHNN